MSLINDMLRDLESRRADDLVWPSLQSEIRPLPLPQKKSWLLPAFIGISLLGLGAVAGVMFWQMTAVAPAVPAALQAAVLPSSSELVAANPLSGFESGRYELRPATSLAGLPAAVMTPPMPQPAKALPPVAPVSRVVAPAAAVAESKAPRAITPAATPAAPAASASIDRQPVLSTARERADAEFRAAQNALSQGRTAEGQEQLRAALRLDASYSPARQALLRSLLEHRRNDEAMTVLSDGIEVQPNQLGWAMSLARLQVDKGDQAAAAKTLARSWPHATGNAEYAGFYGHLQYRLGQAHEAVVLYLTATRLAPGEGRWWFGLGVAQEADAKPAEAREAFRRALGSGSLNADLTALAEQRLK